ncbi:hypothetical protein C0995_006551 [Termitomyces sp. Mi166|nr:hypothetical protein C0995_006551 [Termitomyces sp. Mi166\
MQTNLAAISLVCAVLLAFFIPIARVRQNVANLAIVSWLLGANVVHGINAVIWAGNVELHAPVWCDIVTKLLLGATVALPGAFLSIACRLELVSSMRPISREHKSQISPVMLEFILCYVVPLFYMGLHFIVQDHRFDLVEDYGCSASIHPSAVGLTLMWLPPILLCCASLFLCGASVAHSFNFQTSAFSMHLEQRSPFTYSTFIRRLTITIITSAVLFVVSLFSVFTISQFIPYTSWSAAHIEFITINIVRDADTTRSIKLVWLGVPTVTLVYIALVLALGEETRDAFKWICGRVSKLPKWRPRPLLLLPFSSQTRSDFESRTQLYSPPSKPTLELKSGWDDMLEEGSKKSKFWSPIRKSPTSSLRTTSLAAAPVKFPSPPTSRAATPSSSSATSPTLCGEDDAFIKSTLEYLGSPTAKTLGIALPSLMIPSSPVTSPIVSPPPVYVSPRTATHHDILESPASIRSNHNMPPSPRHVPIDVESVISSVFDASWPQPPPSPPVLAQAVSKAHIPNSRSTSPAASTEIGASLRPTVSVTAPHGHSRPF